MPGQKETPGLKKRIGKVAVKGLSSSPRLSNIIPAGFVPARIGGNMEGQFPGGTLLPRSVVVTQGFHPGHTALDLAGPQGTKIYAPEDLYINQAGRGAWGIDVIGVNPETKNRFTFGHFEAVAPGIVPGKIVKAGTLIGYEGSTFTAPGYSTGPHLHLQENLAGGAAVLPSSLDIMKTFSSSLRIVQPYKKGKSESPAVNTSKLSINPAAVRSVATVNQVGGAINSPAAIYKGLPETSTPAASPVTSSGSSPLDIFKGTILEKPKFFTTHAPVDWALMAGGLFLFLFGALILFGSMMGKEVKKESGLVADFLESDAGKAAMIALI